jgi:ubiquitin-small subunit ribosomal protein S27Ae
MATQEGGATKEKKGKKSHKNKPTSKKYKHFKVTGSTVARGKSCPRCGPGIFLADHKTRLYCGKCKYTEFIQKK